MYICGEKMTNMRCDFEVNFELLLLCYLFARVFVCAIFTFFYNFATITHNLHSCHHQLFMLCAGRHRQLCVSEEKKLSFNETAIFIPN